MMRQHEREDHDDVVDAEAAGPDDGVEEQIALDAVTAWLEIDGDDELAQAQREALVEVAQAALAQKERREASERAAHRRARAAERAEAERLDAVRRARRAQQATEDARLCAAEERHERARPVGRQDAARVQERGREQRATRAGQSVVQSAERRGPPRARVVGDRQDRAAVLAASVSVARPTAAARPVSIAPIAVAALPATTPHTIVAPVLGLANQDNGGVQARVSASQVQTVEVVPAAADEGLPALTGADLAAWRTRLGLTQQAAADRLGVRQGTVSKVESRSQSILGPSVRRALAAALACSPSR